MRVYFPLALTELAPSQLLRCDAGYGVTMKWQELCESEDIDECSEAALTTAAVDAWLAGEQLRMAVAVDMPDREVIAQNDGTVICKRAPEWTEVASIHIDTPDMASLCDAARESEDKFNELCSEPLSWFDASERANVYELIRATAEA